MINDSKRKGFVLPMILVYFFLSHLIYVGLLRYQAIYLQQSNLYQQAYLAKVQSLMIKKKVTDNNREQCLQLSSQLDNHIQETMANIQARVGYVAPLLEEEDFILATNNSEEQAQLLLITVNRYLSEEMYQMLEKNKVDMTHFKVLEKEVDVGDQTYLQDIQTKLAANNYREVLTNQQELVWKWEPTKENQNIYDFNTGQVQLVFNEERNTYYIDSLVDKHHFQKQVEIPFCSIPFQVQYNLTFFQKEVIEE